MDADQISIQDALSTQSGRKLAEIMDDLVVTGLTKHLGRPVHLSEAIMFGQQGRLSRIETLSRPNATTWLLDHVPFLYTENVKITNERMNTHWQLRMDIPHQFISKAA